jgi:hypothetical protein
MHAHPLFGQAPLGEDRATMDAEHACALAARLYRDEFEEDGTPLLAHVGRVAAMVPVDARAVAWLHEALAWTGVAEEDLLLAGLTSEQLRALRLLNLGNLWQSDRAYLGHLELIARSAGRSGGLARIVRIADLRDRCAHPRVRAGGWSPPYFHGLQRLTMAAGGYAGVATQAG